MNKTIGVPNINITLASLAISIKTPTKTTVLVLAEVIRLSENGTILYPRMLQTTICETLKINRGSYQKAFEKLQRMNLVSRDQSILILSPLIKTPFKQIILQQK